MWILELLTNKIAVTTVIALFTCQVWKVIHNLIETNKLNIKKIYATGGMPSSHTTLVAALTVSVGFNEGFTSNLFIISLFFSAIIIRDALGVRRTVDDLIKYVNKIVKENKFGLEQIVKIAGHTPVQVLVGALLGVGIAIISHFLW